MSKFHYYLVYCDFIASAPWAKHHIFRIEISRWFYSSEWAITWNDYYVVEVQWEQLSTSVPLVWSVGLSQSKHQNAIFYSQKCILTVFVYLYYQSIDTFDNLSGGVVYWLAILVENKGNMLPVDILLIFQYQHFCQGWRGYLSSSDSAVEEHLTNEGNQRGGVTKCHSQSLVSVISWVARFGKFPRFEM